MFVTHYMRGAIGMENIGRSQRKVTIHMKFFAEAFLFRTLRNWGLPGLVAIFLLNQVTFGETSPAPRPDLMGQVQTKEGAPIKGVTAFIETAGPKVGSSPYCPSCYADCRKSAKT